MQILIERQSDRTRAAAQGAEAILHLGSSPYADPYLVSTILSVRLPLYPTLRVPVSSGFSEELCRQVLTGELDIAIVAGGLPDSRLNFLHVATHPFYAVLRDQDRSARSMTVTLSDYDERVWILFGRQVHPTLYDQLTGRANELGIKPKEVHHVTIAEQAAHLVLQHGAVAFLTRIGAWRVARGGLTMRPLHEEGLVLKTALVTRADDQSRLTSEFVRAAMRKLKQGTGAHQHRLPSAG